MKNVTISLDDATHRRVRIRAAELGKSMSAYFEELAEKAERNDPSEEVMPSGITRAEFDRMAANEIELRKQVPAGFDPRDRLSREEL